MNAYGTHTNNVFFTDNKPGSRDYDPGGPEHGWYYMDRKMYRVGPFSSNVAATYAMHRNQPAPAVVGKIIEKVTF